jgi:hypothetical protein
VTRPDPRHPPRGPLGPLPSAVAAVAEPGRPWLVAGKGPTAAKLPRLDLSGYRVLTLNHACLVADPAVAHFVDLEPVVDCADRLFELLLGPAPPWLVLPWHPHVRCSPAASTLLDVALAAAGRGEDSPTGVLATALKRGRLASYNSTTAGLLPLAVGLPLVRVRLFSAAAAFNLLAAAGVRGEVATVGVDGGTKYAPQFDEKDRLANGRSSLRRPVAGGGAGVPRRRDHPPTAVGRTHAADGAPRGDD